MANCWQRHENIITNMIATFTITIYEKWQQNILRNRAFICVCVSAKPTPNYN